VKTSLDTLVDDYIRQLERELRPFPGARRREILGEVGEHIAQARSELETESEADLRNVLDRLGEPADIAAAARERYGIRREKAGGLEIVTVIALVVPYVGWVAGSVLVWMSRVWTTRDKVLTSVVVPGTWILFLSSAFVVDVQGTSTITASCRLQPRPATCEPEFAPPPHPTGAEWVTPALWIASFGLPILVSLYLAIRARRLSDPTAA
jgi:uncharacterized membrane protein